MRNEPPASLLLCLITCTPSQQSLRLTFSAIKYILYYANITQTILQHTVYCIPMDPPAERSARVALFACPGAIAHALRSNRKSDELLRIELQFCCMALHFTMNGMLCTTVCSSVAVLQTAWYFLAHLRITHNAVTRNQQP